MIIIRFKGGLGNQLFQYAFAKRIAIERSEQLYFDLRYLTSNVYSFIPRDFKLERLASYKMIDDSAEKNYRDFYGTKNAICLTDDFPKKDISSLINNSSIKAILLDGYFQDEFYFAPYLDLIRSEIKTLLKSYYPNGQLSSRLINSERETVSIHLRRTDYMQPITKSVHGICEIDYYVKALGILNSKLSNPYYYLFSDDTQEAQRLFENLLKEKTNISAIVQQAPSKEDDLVEMAMMSTCKNFIIANSSFSWWGSYLSDAKSKLVIAPKRWYLSENLRREAEGIILKSWIRI